MSLQFLDKQLLRGLVDENIPFYDVMTAFNIRTTIANLPFDVHAFVYVSKKNNYHIIMNGNLSSDTQYKVFCHELKHILSDLPSKGYIVGLNMQYENFERSADLFVKEIGIIYRVG